MKYSISAIVLGFFAAFNAAAPTPDDKPDPGQVTITGVIYVGFGCPAGKAAVSHSPDLSTVTIIFDEYKASIGPGNRFADQAKNCNLNFKVNYPPGYQYTIYKSAFTGYGLLEKGVTLKQMSSYWFASFVNDKPTFQSTLVGPYNSDYTLTDTLQYTVWSPYGASTTLSINTQLVLTSSDPQVQALINISSIDSKMEYQQAYDVNWRRCS